MKADWWKWLFFRRYFVDWCEWLPHRRWRIIGTVQAADEVPDYLPRNGIVLVISEEMLKWVAFDCPCRTGHRIMLNTDRRRQPYWRIFKYSKNRLTIYPSVDHKEGYKRCHYFIRSGRILWAKGKNQ